MDQVTIFSNVLVFNDEIYGIEVDHNGSSACTECPLDNKLCCIMDDNKKLYNFCNDISRINSGIYRWYSRIKYVKVINSFPISGCSIKIGRHKSKSLFMNSYFKRWIV